MSLPILVTPAAKSLQPKPPAPVAPSDKPSFSKTIDAAERRSDSPKPADAKPEAPKPDAAKPEAAKPEPKDAHADPKDSTPASDQVAAKDPQPEVSEQVPQDAPVAQPAVDVQVMVAVASQLVMPVAQANAQPVPETNTQAVAQAAAQAAAQAGSQVETAVQAPVQEAIAAAIPVAQPAAGEKATVPQPATLPQGVAVPVDVKTAVKPSEQQTSGDQQKPSEDSNAQADKGPKPPVMPVATQHVSQSIESLRASDKVATLVNAAPESPLAKQPVVDAAKPAQEAATAALVTEAVRESDEPKPAAEAVRPWQLPHAVGGAEAPAPQAQVIDNGAPSGETVPMHEAMRMPFTQAAKEPGKPSELRLQLSPEYLGRMEIRVMSHEGTLSAQIRVDHAQARDMMQTQLAELRQSLADQGIKIDRLEVSVGQDKSRGEQSFAFGGNLQQQAGQQQQQAHQATGGRVSYYGAESFDEEGEVAEGLPQAAVGATAVDYQA